MLQGLDTRSFFGHPQFSVTKFSALILEVLRNRFSGHGPSVAELSPSKLSTFGHSDNLWLDALRWRGLGGIIDPARPREAAALRS